MHRKERQPWRLLVVAVLTAALIALQAPRLTHGAETDAAETIPDDVAEFVMPAGTECEPQSTIVEVADGVDLDEMANDLAETLGPVTIDRVADGYARLTYDGDATVEDAVNEVLESGYVEAAQPNYVYHVLDDVVPVEASQDGEPTAGDPDEDVEVADVEDGTEGAGATEQVLSETEDEAETAPSDEDVALETQAAGINDPYASRQWGLNSMGAHDAWAYAKGNHKVTVATLDLGFQVGHEDLAANVVDPYNAHNAVYGGSTSNVTPYNYESDHGTHVAGIIGAVANNGVGIAGISYNANVMPVKVVGSSGRASTTDLIKAYDYVLSRRVARNVRVINLSMGADVRSINSLGMSLNEDDALIGMIKRAYDQGVVTVCACGNKSASYDNTVPYACYPADSDNAVSVINLMQSGSGVARSPKSNYNATNAKIKDVSAPGTDILSTVSFNDYANMGGTSMAAPYVAGVLALVFAANPNLSAPDAVTLLYATATDLGGTTWSRGYGWGEVNAAMAVRAAISGMTSAQQAKAAAVRPYVPGSHAYTPTNPSTPSNSNPPSATPVVSEPSVLYRTHVQKVGWQGWKKNGAMSGTSGKSRRLEAIKIKLADAAYSGSIEYRTHIQTYGWEKSWKAAGKTSGTSGKAKRLEAIKIRLTGDMAQHYDVYYRVHAQRFGWMGWAKNGARAGTAGYAYRLEGIQIRLVPKGGAAPGTTAKAFRSKR